MAREELCGTIESAKRLDSGFTIITLRGKQTAIGMTDEGAVIEGLPYRLVGEWKKHAKYGPQFAFIGFTQDEPNSRDGVVEYLVRIAKLTRNRAEQIVDLYSPRDAIGMLKRAPEDVAAKTHMPLKKAKDAASELMKAQRFQETKIKLMDLFAGRGFRHSLVDQCVKAFGVKAPERIRRDPFCLLVQGFAGCGFMLVDRLYHSLGLPLDRLKRQVICAWWIVREDNSGGTWVPWEQVKWRMGQVITGRVQAERALKIALRAKWLAARREGGRVWLAEGRRAANEKIVAQCLERLMG